MILICTIYCIHLRCASSLDRSRTSSRENRILPSQLYRSNSRMQTLGLRNPPIISSRLLQGDIAARSYGLRTFCYKFCHHLASKSSNSSGVPRLLSSTQGTLKSTKQHAQNKKHMLTCQAAALGTSQVAAASPAAATTAAYSKLQNGSDIRGIALDSKYYSC